MQYHLNGFLSGDPNIATVKSPLADPSATDVLIVGCGPAGLTLAAQLSAFPDISVRIIDQKPGPLQVGQADGIACRSMEMFEAFGIADSVLREAYQVNEVAFWRAHKSCKGITRVDRIQDVEDDLSEMPHVILNQARVHDFLLEKMQHSSHALQPDYHRELLSIEPSANTDYPLRATLNCLDLPEHTETINAKFVVGCDGARSKVRHLLGYELKGEAARQLWGVMDVLLTTDFPDIRMKCAIQSEDKGSILIIPREGGYLVRLYIELDELHGNERASDRQLDANSLISKAKAIMCPYSLDVKQVAWWSAYEIGQRVCDSFDDVPANERGKQTPRIFIAGDACHTHSPKAGQGMNVSMADGFNLGWKLGMVLTGKAPINLLDTYSEERCAKAKELIEFDKDMARLFSAKPQNENEVKQFQRYFKKHGRYTAGVETQYAPNLITANGEYQSLAAKLTVGKRFHSAPVTRLSDARVLHLGHTLKADGRWRLIAFAGNDDIGKPDQAIAQLCRHLSKDKQAILHRITPKGADIDSVIDVRAVFQACHRDLDIGCMPTLLLPQKGVYGLVDYEKIFCAPLNSDADIYELRGINRAKGALLIVRPDQYVSQVLPLAAFAELDSFLYSVLQCA